MAVPLPALRALQENVTSSPGAEASGAVKAVRARSGRVTVSAMAEALFSSSCSLTSPFLSVMMMRCALPSA